MTISYQLFTLFIFQWKRKRLIHHFLYSDLAAFTAKKLSKAPMAGTFASISWFPFPSTQLDYILQLPLQYGVAMSLSSSQWDMNRRNMNHFKAKVFKRCVCSLHTSMLASLPARCNRGCKATGDGKSQEEMTGLGKKNYIHIRNICLWLLFEHYTFLGLFIIIEYPILKSIRISTLK